MTIIDRLRAWWRDAPDRGVTVKNTGSITQTGGGYANTGVDRTPRLRAVDNPDRDPARHEFAARLSEGRRYVVMPREVANYAENLLTAMLAADALHRIGRDYDGLKVAGCRQALSDAIEATDRYRFGAADHPTINMELEGLTHRQATEAIQATSASATAAEMTNPDGCGYNILITGLDVPGALAVLAAITRTARS